MTTQPGEVIKPDTFKSISEEGMPIQGKPYEKGNLYVRFEVLFPDSLTTGQVSTSALCDHHHETATSLITREVPPKISNHPRRNNPRDTSI